MVVRKRKKVTKYRSHTTHGGGHRKKRRGAGSRGGRGNAGSGKRAGHKRRGVVLGKSGFKARTRHVSVTKTVNVSYFTPERLAKLEAAGTVSKEGDVFVLDLKALGFTKLLGSGSVGAKLKLISGVCSKKAADKLVSAGGSVPEQ